jgi:uncharacterized protein YndB with AHSA1/START domain
MRRAEMAKILLRFPVAAERDAVYRALASEAGVRGWWSEKTEGPAGTDSVMKVAFPDAPITFDFEVTEDLPSERVAWRCLAGPPEWIGTELSFDLKDGDGGEVAVDFTHDGWKTTTDSFPFIAYSWAQIFPRLKRLAETGEENPYFSFSS